jgi:hypothetical protein
MQTASSLKDIAAAYIDAAGSKDYDALAGYLTDDVSFKGPFMSSDSSAAFIASLKRMAPIWVRNDVRAAFSEGDRAAVFYDFVTNTPAGALQCAELLTFRGDRIASIELLFDRQSFAPAAQALAAAR